MRQAQVTQATTHRRLCLVAPRLWANSPHGRG